MGCTNSKFKRRFFTQTESNIPIKNSKPEAIDNSVHLDPNKHETDVMNGTAYLCVNGHESNRTIGKKKWTRFQCLASPEEFDRRRKSRRSIFSSKLFKRKRSAEAAQDGNIGVENLNDCVSVVGSSAKSDRKWSVAALATPTIVIDEAPPSSTHPSSSGGMCLSPGRVGSDSEIGNCGRRSNEKSFFRLRKSSSVNEDWVLRIVRCFPFPSPRHSPRHSPVTSPTAGNSANSKLRKTSANGGTNNEDERKTREKQVSSSSDDAPTYLTLGTMVKRTVQTAFPPLIPWDWDKWLRKRLASWTQCSGHEGTVVPATEKTVWKKCAHNSNEAKAYHILMDDAACAMAPKFYKEVEHQGEWFLELEDLSRDFVNPCIMDVKMGTRTFLESEVRKNTKRSDLYEKMVSIDSSEPTPSEQEEKAITKLRYMMFRENLSSTASLGFRIDALKMSDGPLQKHFQKVRKREEVMDVFRRFIGPNNVAARDSLLQRLLVMREKIEQSQFFRTHEVIGSSVLIMRDSETANAWIIDFANVLPIEPGFIDHRATWEMGNREDGYLFGLDNMIKVIEDLDLDDTIYL